MKTTHILALGFLCGSVLAHAQPKIHPATPVENAQMFQGERPSPTSRWVLKHSDKTFSHVVSRWTNADDRLAYWMVPFDPYVASSPRLNALLGEATTTEQAIKTLMTEYNRTAPWNKTIATCLYAEGKVAAVFHPDSPHQNC